MTVTPESNAREPVSGSDALNALIPEFLSHLVSGDARAAAALWDVPALILGDRHVHGPLSSERLESLFADTSPVPRGGGETRRRNPLEHWVTQVEWVARRVATIEARWPLTGFRGFLQGISAATFLVRLDELGQPKLRGVLLRDA
jgi:hypothetical protein